MIESNYNIYLDGKDNVLCFNTISGALVELDTNRVYNNELVIDSFSNEEIEFLVSKHYLMKDNNDEISTLKILHRQKCFNDLGLNIIILPTLDCQAKCSYCFQPNEKTYMSESTIDNILASLKSYFHGSINKHLSVCWFGGEPMMDKAWLGVEYFYNNLSATLSEHMVHLTTVIISNGEYLNEDKIIFLKMYGLAFIQITLDGPREIHNRVKQCDIYDKVIENINLLNKNDVHVGIRINVSNDYDNKIEELLDDLTTKLKQKDLVDMHFAPITKFNSLCHIDKEISIKDFAGIQLEYIEMAIRRGFRFSLPDRKDTYCQALHTNSAIYAPDGKKYLCTTGIYDNEDYANINDPTYTNQNNYTKYICYDPFDDQSCVKCKIFPICKGGVYKGENSGEKSMLNPEIQY
ncbi:MAG: radical SAM protein [Candidatus Cloacimonetes bacterium]|nr:radical SAM protein [Candidatus Cloacimonadota bacterium]